MSVALNSLANVKQALSITGNARDDALTQLIEEVSSYIIETTGCEFAPKTEAPEARTVEYRSGERIIDLWPFQARSVTEVVVEHSLPGARTLAAGAFTLAPIANRYGVYDFIELDTTCRAMPGGRRVPVRVTGLWGWPTVPPNVLSWLHRIVDQRFRDESAFFADADGTMVERPDTIPFAIREEMERMRRVRIGSV